MTKFVMSKQKIILGYEFCWWGWSQWHKWRWHGTHIDLGPLSVYNIPEGDLFWRLISLSVKPFRWLYHRYACSARVQARNEEILNQMDKQLAIKDHISGTVINRDVEEDG